MANVRNPRWRMAMWFNESKSVLFLTISAAIWLVFSKKFGKYVRGTPFLIFFLYIQTISNKNCETTPLPPHLNIEIECGFVSGPSGTDFELRGGGGTKLRCLTLFC